MCGLSSPGRATPADTPDVEIARRHFDRGSELYERGNYAAAIVEFGYAREVRPVPELDYNIARCYDRLEQRQAAIEAYQRYLAAAPHASGADEARQRVATLRARLLEPAALPQRREFVAPIVLGVSALVVGGVAAGLVGSVAGPFDNLATGRCATYCDPSVYANLQNRAIAGYVLFGVAGALALEDVICWGLAARKRR
jgi:tetratricopeptide (TPR) repeat protein